MDLLEEEKVGLDQVAKIIARGNREPGTVLKKPAVIKLFCEIYIIVRRK